MSVIRCNLDLFAYEQTIYLQENNKIKIIAKVPMDNLSNFITEYCNTNNINEVHIIGFTEFAKQIQKEILEVNSTKYSNNSAINIILEKKENK